MKTSFVWFILPLSINCATLFLVAKYYPFDIQLNIVADSILKLGTNYHITMVLSTILSDFAKFQLCFQALLLHSYAVCIWPHAKPEACQHSYVRQSPVQACQQIC